MFCIAAFIVLVLMAAVSAKYRAYLKKAWGCVARRVTFRACDTSFKNEAKSKLLAPIALRHPRWLRPASIGLEIAAVLVVLLTVWSLYEVAKSSLSLYVYGTCAPSNSAACSLGAEACSIESGRLGLGEALTSWRLGQYVVEEAREVGDLVASVPTRLRDWRAEDYAPADASYLRPYDATKPTAVEIIDPGCQYCAQLYANIERAAMAERYNLTYIAYPIRGKFANSELVVSYLEAIRQTPLAGAETPVDWQVLDRIFVGHDDQGAAWQPRINSASTRQVEAWLTAWLEEFGYTPAEVAALTAQAHSPDTATRIDESRRLVEDDIRTVKIPTIIFDGRRHDGVVSSDEL